MGLFDQFRNKKRYENTATAAQLEATRRRAKTGFKVFLEKKANTAWISDYITDQNEIHTIKAYAHMSEGGYQISDYTADAFCRMVGTYYALYMGLNASELREPLSLLELIADMPLNITIRRVKPKASGNNWSVQYLRGTKYYGKTLFDSIERLKSRNAKVAAKFVQDEGSVEEK